MSLALFGDERVTILLCFERAGRLYIDLTEPELINNGYNSYHYSFPVVVDKGKADPLIRPGGLIPVTFECGTERLCYPGQVFRYPRNRPGHYEDLYCLKPS